MRNLYHRYQGRYQGCMILKLRMTIIFRKEFSQLFSLDQLNTARANGDAFSELDEEEPKFAPTYKFKIGTSEYDLKRAPAW